MKKLLIIFFGFTFHNNTEAQLKTGTVCPVFKAEVLEGTVSGLDSRSTFGEVAKKFPCFSSKVEETNGATCGGLFYKEKDIYFYTERDYIEIGEKFKGELNPSLMGKSRTSLFSLLGYPKIKETGWDAFQTQYGILILYYNKAGKINKLQMSKQSTDTIKLCE